MAEQKCLAACKSIKFRGYILLCTLIDQIRQEMFNCFGTRQAATIYTATNDYQVILECKPEFQTDISALSRISGAMR